MKKKLSNKEKKSKHGTAERLKAKIKKHKIGKSLLACKKSICRVRSMALDIQAPLLLKRQKKKAKLRVPGPLRVGFFCQYPQNWDKYDALYKAMVRDERFTPFIICLPIAIKNHKLIANAHCENDAFSFIKNEKGYDCIDAVVSSSEWFDLKKLNLDYLFYARPYNSFWPKQYTSHQVCKNTKVCLFMYGAILNHYHLAVTHDEDFFRDLALYFAESPQVAEINKNRYSLTHKAGLQKSLYCGAPSLYRMLHAQHDPAPAWSFSDRKHLRVIWTPRWTDSVDRGGGGSHFLEYKDKLIDYAKVHPDIDFIFRPHPNTLNYYVETGKMTLQEVADFKQINNQVPNIYFDESGEYYATFWQSDLLITDLSGVVPEYFMTGKPIIYCEDPNEGKPLDYFEQIKKSFYSAHSINDVLTFIDEIEMNDSLKALRERTKSSLVEFDASNVPNNILDALIEDAGLS